MHLIQGKPAPLPHRGQRLIEIGEIVLAQLLPEMLARPRQPGTDRADGGLHDAGDLGAGVAFHVVQQHHLSLLQRQPVDHLAQLHSL